MPPIPTVSDRQAAIAVLFVAQDLDTVTILMEIEDSGEGMGPEQRLNWSILHRHKEGVEDAIDEIILRVPNATRTMQHETAVHTLKDAPHPFWMSDPWCAETVEIAAAFFKKHLGEPVTK